MPKYKYSIIGLDPDKTAKASGRNLHISPKDAREVCKELRNKMLDNAKNYLENVMAQRQRVPFKRYKKHVGHHAGLNKWYTGRYPIRASSEIMKVLRNAEANAEFKGLDIDRLKIVHIMIHRARPVFPPRYIPRARGRATPYYTPRSHVEVVLEEV